MILGMPTPTFTLLHVAISLMAIATGAVVIFGMCHGRLLGAWTLTFLVTAGATSMTGFLFHPATFGPPHVIGIISLGLLALAVHALYSRRLDGRWRSIYVVSAVMVLYLNAFVGVVQAFQKLPDLRALSAGPSYALAHALVVSGFFAVGMIALRRFRPATRTAT